MDQNLEDFTQWLFTQECIFIRGAESTISLPDPIFPEIAFVGRSNVGKSSLINAILGRKALARVSHTPGRTQQLNFFLLGNTVYIVDMPGYGYAAVSKTKLELLSRLITDYLKGRSPLKRVFLLIDSRHGLKPPDLSVMDILDKAAISYQLILTKTDKCSPTHLEKLSTSLTETLKTHQAAFPVFLSTSSVEKRGIEQVRKTIAALIF